MGGLGMDCVIVTVSTLHIGVDEETIEQGYS